jgi:hypothetical protein
MSPPLLLATPLKQPTCEGLQSTETSGLFVWLVADGWCWFVLREKYYWLVADKPSEQAADLERVRKDGHK